MDIMSYKSLDQVNLDTEKKRKKYLPEFDGKIINNLLKINDENVHELYSNLNKIHEQLIFSKAEDEFLDHKGEVFNCKRSTGEGNINYRERISKQNVANSAGNKISLEIIELEIPEIVDMDFKQFTFGTGSFSVSVMTDDVITPESILEEVRQKIQDNKTFGNKFEVVSPELLKVLLSIKLFISREKSDSEKEYISNKAKEDIRKYINALKLGETLSKERLENIIFEYDSVKDYQVFNFEINKEKKNFKNQVSEWNERFLEDNSKDAITII